MKNIQDTNATTAAQGFLTLLSSLFSSPLGSFYPPPRDTPRGSGKTCPVSQRPLFFGGVFFLFPLSCFLTGDGGRILTRNTRVGYSGLRSCAENPQRSKPRRRSHWEYPSEDRSSQDVRPPIPPSISSFNEWGPTPSQRSTTASCFSLLVAMS